MYMTDGVQGQAQAVFVKPVTALQYVPRMCYSVGVFVM